MNKNTEIMFRHVLRELEGAIELATVGKIAGDFDEETGSAVFNILEDAKSAIYELKTRKEGEDGCS